MQGTVLALALRPVKSQALIVQDTLELSPKTGVIGDHGTSRRRQVSLLDEAAWKAACIEVGEELDWTTRRSNVLVSGLDLQTLVGNQIRLGSALSRHGCRKKGIEARSKIGMERWRLRTCD